MRRKDYSMTKKHNKHLLGVCFTALLCCLGLTACNGIFDNFNDAINADESSQSTINSKVTREYSVSVKRLSTGRDSNNHDYQTFSYETTPVYVSNPNPEIEITFADNRTNGANYLTYTIDAANKTFTITCLHAFNRQATVRLKFSTSVYADLTVDYKQRIDSVSITANYEYNYNFDSSKWNNGTTSDTHDRLYDIYAAPGAFTINYTNEYTIPVQVASSEIQLVSVDDGVNGSTVADYLHIYQAVGGYSAQYYWQMQYLVAPAMQNMPVACSSTNRGYSFYKYLNDQWQTLNASQKQSIADNLINGRILIPLNLGNANLTIRHGTDTFTSPAGDLYIFVQPMPSWSIGTSVTSVTIETPSTSF